MAGEADCNSAILYKGLEHRDPGVQGVLEPTPWTPRDDCMGEDPEPWAGEQMLTHKSELTLMSLAGRTYKLASASSCQWTREQGVTMPGPREGSQVGSIK